MTDLKQKRQFEEASLLNEALEDVKRRSCARWEEALLQLKEKI